MSTKKIIGIAGLATLFFILLLIFMRNIVYISQQERGVVLSPYEELGLRPESLEPGWHFLRVGEEAVIYNLEPQTYAMGIVNGVDDSIRSKTADGREVFVDASVTYRLNPETLFELHVAWQNRYQDELVRPATRNSIRDVILQYPFAEITAKRPEIEQAIFSLLSNFLMENYLILEKFDIQEIR